LPYRMSYNGK